MQVIETVMPADHRPQVSGNIHECTAGPAGHPVGLPHRIIVIDTDREPDIVFIDLLQHSGSSMFSRKSRAKNADDIQSIIVVIFQFTQHWQQQ